MDKLEYIKKEARATELAMEKLFQETYKKVMEENAKRGLSKYEFFVECRKKETDDQQGNEQKITLHRKKGCDVYVWTSNVWLNSNVIPESIRSEVIDSRFPVKAVSYWYKPYCYMWKLSHEELYEQSEKEKLLYEDDEVKVSIIRRNVIPFFKSSQYCAKMSEPEYVFYVKTRRKDDKIEEKIDQINKRLRELTEKGNSKEKEKLINQKCKLYDKISYWHECVHADKLNDLFKKAKRYFNDW